MKNNGNRCILYHGSEFVIQKPIYGGGKVHNDYGSGFYCTKEPDLAKEWAVGETHDGFANRYEFDLAGLKVVDLSRKDYTVLHWLSILLENRVFDMRGDVITAASQYFKANFSVDYGDADVMIGYRADDNYFSFARAFLNGSRSYERLGRTIRLGDLGLQFVLKSRKAFERIRFLDAEPAMRTACLERRLMREESARAEYVRIVAEPFDPKALYMTNILQQEIKSDDPRL